MSGSVAEAYLRALFADAKLPQPAAEYQFAPPRRWRFDFAWPEQRLALEVDGITPSGGRHQRFVGYMADCEKKLAAQVAGWRVIVVPSPWITSKKHARPNEIVAAVRRMLDYTVIDLMADGAGDRLDIPYPKEEEA